MRSIIFLISLIFLTSCPKGPSQTIIDCGGCGLKQSGNKYKELKKGKKVKNKQALPNTGH